MARVHYVAKARKDNPAVKKGESYYWWKFRYGPKRYSRTRPTRSQLTSSEFLSTICEIEDERIAKLGDTQEVDLDALKSEVSDIADELRNLGSEQEEKLQNMPEGLQEGDVGELLQERASACEEMADALEAVDLDYEPEKGDFEEWYESVIDELTSIGYEGV